MLMFLAVRPMSRAQTPEIFPTRIHFVAVEGMEGACVSALASNDATCARHACPLFATNDRAACVKARGVLRSTSVLSKRKHSLTQPPTHRVAIERHAPEKQRVA